MLDPQGCAVPNASVRLKTGATEAAKMRIDDQGGFRVAGYFSRFLPADSGSIRFPGDGWDIAFYCRDLMSRFWAS